jgi:TMEM175 potassium channel family protein
MESAAGPQQPADGGAVGPLSRSSREFLSRGVDRFSLFSDAVIAIAITLLAIELPVPEGDTVSTLWASVRHEDGHYAAFLISFCVIAASWSDHFDLFRCIDQVDARLRTLNAGWLLMIILNPFATRLLTTPGHPTLEAHALRFGFYALLQVLDGVLMLAMVAHMNGRRLAPRTPPELMIHIVHQDTALALGFGLSIPVFFVTGYAWILWFAVPIAIRVRGRIPLLNYRGPKPGGAG